MTLHNDCIFLLSRVFIASKIAIPTMSVYLPFNRRPPFVSQLFHSTPPGCWRRVWRAGISNRQLVKIDQSAIGNACSSESYVVCTHTQWNSFIPIVHAVRHNPQYREIFWQNGSLLYGSDTAKQEFFMRLQLRLQSLHKHDFISNQLLFYCWLTQQHFNFSVSFSFKNHWSCSLIHQLHVSICMGMRKVYQDEKNSSLKLYIWLSFPAGIFVCDCNIFKSTCT